MTKSNIVLLILSNVGLFLALLVYPWSIVSGIINK